MKRPLFWCGLTSAAVTLMAFALPWWLTASVALVFAALFWWRRRAVCAVLILAFLVLAVGYRHWYIDPTRHLDGQRDTVTGVVVETPAYGQMYTVEVTDSSVLRHGTRIVLLCNGDEKPALHDVVVAKVRLHAASDESRSFAAQGAFVRAFPANYLPEDLTVVGSVESPLSRWMYRVRRALTAPCRDVVPEPESGVFAAVCFGNTAYLDNEVVASFRNSGLSHLLVVSGLHVSFVALALYGLLRRTGRRIACVGALLGVWFFAWLVGFSPSVVRAATMGSVWLVGKWLFCRADGLNSLGLAAMVVLGANPCAVFHGGCQLSFAATCGVLLLTPRLVPSGEMDYDRPWWHRLWQRLRRAVLGGAAACLSALLFTLPIAVYHYGGFSVTALVSNVLAVAPVGAMMVLGWLGSLLSGIPLLAWLGKALLTCAGLLARYVVTVARLCSPDWAWLSVPHTWQRLLLCGVCLIGVCGILCRVSARRLLAVVTLLSVTAFCIGTPLTSSYTQVTALSLDNEGAFIVTQGDRCALLVTHGRELDEAAYAVDQLDPDAIFVGDATAEDMARLTRFPEATVFGTAAVERLAGNRPVTVCPEGGTVILWEGCSLTVVSAAWWRLQVGAERVYICLDPKSTPMDGEYLCIYVGGTPTHPPQGAYGVICTKAWLRRRHPTPTGRETFIVERPITYVPQGGEWRVMPWL